MLWIQVLIRKPLVVEYSEKGDVARVPPGIVIFMS